MRRDWHLLAAVLGWLLLAAGARAAPALMPWPESVALPQGRLDLGDGLAVVWSGPHDALLDRAVARFRDNLERRFGVAIPAARGTVLHIQCAASDPGFPRLGTPERYRLVVDGSGALLQADGPAGVLHGLATLLQLAELGKGGAQLDFARIDDAPRYAWRGIMIDVARHFVSLDGLRRQIDAMEQVKLDVLHLHLSDAQGFRVESRLFPRLQSIASHGQFYTQAEMRKLVAYARDRGVRIVPEFDLPGHSLALLRAYPALSAEPLAQADPDDVDAVAMDPTLPRTQRMVAALYGEMCGLFPDRYFHVGGDEVRSQQWLGNARIRATMAVHHVANTQALQAEFERRIRGVLARHGKIMVGWDEVSEADIPSSVVVEPWRSSKFIASATAHGNPVVVSAGYYLDLLLPASDYYEVDPADPTANGLTAAQMAAVRARKQDEETSDAFARDPAARLNAVQAGRILGAEAPLWSEIVDEQMLDGRLWPRAAALAERFWSQAGVRDLDDMTVRLEAVQDELCMLGLRAEANRARMIARLAPGQTEAVSVLVDVVTPIRNYTHNHKTPPGMTQPLNTLADAAATESFTALTFARQARRFAAGDRTLVGEMERQLLVWQANDARYAAVASGRPILQAASPVSRNLAALATIGLEAIHTVLAGKMPGMDWRAAAESLLDRQAQAEAASDNIRSVPAAVQPPADLLLAVVPGIRDLVGAALVTKG